MKILAFYSKLWLWEKFSDWLVDQIEIKDLKESLFKLNVNDLIEVASIKANTRTVIEVSNSILWDNKLNEVKFETETWEILPLSEFLASLLQSMELENSISRFTTWWFKLFENTISASQAIVNKESREA